MTIELQDRVWPILPKEFKEEVKREYKICSDGYRVVSAGAEKLELRGCLRELEDLFGHHNLTSDEEGEEMLTVPRKKVQEFFAKCKEVTKNPYSYSDYSLESALSRMALLDILFGSKCLPDELNEDNFAKSEPKPAEPKNEGTRQEQYIPKNAESGTHSFNHILKDDFREHNRLHIAAMAMQGILSNADRMKGYEYVATEPPCEELAVVVARNALRYADALIAECEKV